MDGWMDWMDDDNSHDDGDDDNGHDDTKTKLAMTTTATTMLIP